MGLLGLLAGGLASGALPAQGAAAAETPLARLARLAAWIEGQPGARALAERLGTLEGTPVQIGPDRLLLRLVPPAGDPVKSYELVARRGQGTRPDDVPLFLGVNFQPGQGPTLGELRALYDRELGRAGEKARPASERRLPSRVAANRGAVSFPFAGAVLDLELFDRSLWHHPQASSSRLAILQVRLYSSRAARSEGIYPGPARRARAQRGK